MNFHTTDMREIWVHLVQEAARKNKDIVMVEADLATALKSQPFFEEFPTRAINVGVAEANMIGVAAGLSNMGKIPFTHTFTPFATRRAFDQITLSVAYAGLNVKMVGSDPGITAELNGGTHMSLEDVGIMRTMPTMTIVEPVDGVQLQKLFPQILEHYGPVYIRLLRKGNPDIFSEDDEITLGKISKINDGSDITIFATGIMVEESMEAVKLLNDEGIHASLYNIHTIKPLDVEGVVNAVKDTKACLTVENHNIINGLGSAVAETLMEHSPVPMERIGTRDHFGEVGKVSFLKEKYGLTAKEIVAAAKRVIARK